MLDKKRNFKQISITAADKLKTSAAKKELASLIGITLPAGETAKPFVFSNEQSIIFDLSRSNDYLKELQSLPPETRHKIINFYIVSPDSKQFNHVKSRVQKLLGHYKEVAEKKHPMKDGFPANLEYFRLDFLDKDHVRLGRQFREILPLLWLRSGGKGIRPRLPKNKALPSFLIKEENCFAVLLDESYFADFALHIKGASKELDWIFLVTDSNDLFQEMASALPAPNIVQLYREYLENFTINSGETNL